MSGDTPTTDRWIIRRRNAADPDQHRYVTGPHHDLETNGPVYGSTDDPWTATAYSLADAEQTIRGRWHGLNPEILPAPPYDPKDD